MAAKDDALADLASQTKDSDVLIVLSKYHLDLGPDTICKSLMKCSADQLKKTAQFLNYGTSIDLKKLELSNFIIRKVENFLPEECTMCNEKYQIQFGKIPALTCLLCGQGVHQECYQEMTSGTVIPNIKGLHWLCGYCEPRACIGSGDSAPNRYRNETTLEPHTNNIKDCIPLIDEDISATLDNADLPFSESGDPVHKRSQPNETPLMQNCTPIGQLNQIEENTAGPSTTALPHKPPVRDQKKTQPPSLKNNKAKICSYYQKNKCKYGVSGNGCAFRHPRWCQKFMTNGRNGCDYGRDCKFLHPQVCYSSKYQGECLKKDCKFAHMKGTKRIPSLLNIDTSSYERQKNSSLAPQTSERSSQPSDSHAPNQIPSQAPLSAQHQTHLQSDDFSSQSSSSFLGVLQLIQQQLKTVEMTQQSQATILQSLITRQPTLTTPHTLCQTQPGMMCWKQP